MYHNLSLRTLLGIEEERLGVVGPAEPVLDGHHRLVLGCGFESQHCVLHDLKIGLHFINSIPSSRYNKGYKPLKI